MLHRRADRGFLAFLFVLPEWQGRGPGARAAGGLPDGAGQPGPDGRLREADQPVSTGLYAGMGLLPRTPLYLLRGRRTTPDLPELPATACGRRRSTRGVAAELDEEVVGYQRPQDHAWCGRQRPAGLAGRGRGWRGPRLRIRAAERPPRAGGGA